MSSTAETSNFTDIFYYSGELRRIAELKGYKEMYTPTEQLTKKGDQIYKYEMFDGDHILFASNAMKLMNRRTGQVYFAVFKNQQAEESQPRELSANEKEILKRITSVDKKSAPGNCTI